MANIIERALVGEYEGPMAKVRYCKVPGCKFHVTVRKGLRNVGRGYGMKYGNKARGEIIQHIKTAHPAEVAALKQRTTI